MNDKVLYEGESEEPFEELHKFKRKTFGDATDRDFYKSEFRSRLKALFNNGGEITIKINKKSWEKKDT